MLGTCLSLTLIRLRKPLKVGPCWRRGPEKVHRLSTKKDCRSQEATRSEMLQQALCGRGGIPRKTKRALEAGTVTRDDNAARSKGIGDRMNQRARMNP